MPKSCWIVAPAGFAIGLYGSLLLLVIWFLMAIVIGVYFAGRNEWVCAIRKRWIHSNYNAYSRSPEYNRMLYRYWWDWRSDVKYWENRA